MSDGNVDAWEDLQEEIKDFVRKKETDIWNNVVGKVNRDYEGSRKELLVGGQRVRRKQ